MFLMKKKELPIGLYWIIIFNNEIYFIIIIIIDRAMFIIDNKGILRQITINDCHVSRSAPEARRLIEAIQHSEKSQPNTSKAGFIKGEKTQNYIYIYIWISVYLFFR